MTRDKQDIACGSFSRQEGQQKTEKIDEASQFESCTCNERLAEFKKSAFDLRDKPCNSRPQEFLSDDLRTHLDYDPTQPALELAEMLDIDH